MKYIVLDSSPLGLLTQRGGVPEADACRRWLAGKAGQGIRALIPEIVDYELRRELLRSGKTASVARLDELQGHPAVAFVPLTTAAMRLAADLWAQARRRGLPAAHPHALDVDVILAAQVIAANFPVADTIIATSNVGHLSMFLSAEMWTKI
jgi:predicted nucleic acid-binding protein